MAESNFVIPLVPAWHKDNGAQILITQEMALDFESQGFFTRARAAELKLKVALRIIPGYGPEQEVEHAPPKIDAAQVAAPRAPDVEPKQEPVAPIQGATMIEAPPRSPRIRMKDGSK